MSPAAPDGGETLLPPAAVAEQLGVTSRTVVRWAEDGTLRTAHRTAGGHRRFRQADVDAFLEARREGQTPAGTKW